MKNIKTNDKKKEKKVSSQKNTIILTISLFLLLIVNNGIGGLNEFIQTSIMNYLENRTLYVSFMEDELDDKQVQNFIENQKETEAICKYAADSFNLSDIKLDEKEAGEFINVEPYNVNVMKKYMITESVEQLESDEIIVGKYANFSIESLENVDVNTKIIDMEQYIGKTITCTLDAELPKDRKQYAFRIVGVFDNIKAGKTSPFYVSKKTYEEMLEGNEYYYEAVDEQGNAERFYQKEYQVIVKDSKSATKLESKIYSEFDGITVSHPVNFPDMLIHILNGIILVGDFIIFYIIFNSISNIIYVTEDNLKKRRREFGILKAIGYKNKDMRNILLKESLMSSAKAIGISGVLGMLLFVGMRWYVNNNMSIYFRSLSFSTKPHTFLLYFSIAIGVPLIGFTYGYKRLKNITAVDALRSE